MPNHDAAPFAWICSGCGADVDAPDRIFESGHPVLVPHADYLLVELRCLTCGRASDAAIWIVDHAAFARDIAEGDVGIEPLADGTPLARYRAMVEESRSCWQEAAGRGLRSVEPDHPDVDWSSRPRGPSRFRPASWPRPGGGGRRSRSTGARSSRPPARSGSAPSSAS